MTLAVPPPSGVAMTEHRTVAVTEWRVGRHYPIHVYEGDTPVATFFTAADAWRAVEDHNDVNELRAQRRAALNEIAAALVTPAGDAARFALLAIRKALGADGDR